MIQCVNFSKGYRKRDIINKSSFEINSNKVSFLMGPNGSGKTTFIKCLMDMEKYEGNFIFDNKNLAQIKQECLVIWDDCPFYTNLSGIKNLMIFGENKKNKEHIMKIASKYIDYELLISKVKTYSYGQKKRLALVLVEILEPKYLIMDEISNGLDYEMMKVLKKYIKNWSKTMTVLLTGHQFSFYNNLIDYLYIIKDKKIKLFNVDLSTNNLKLEDIYDEEMH